MALAVRAVNNKENVSGKVALHAAGKGIDVEKRPALTFISNNKSPKNGVKRSNSLRSQVLVKEAARASRVPKKGIFEDAIEAKRNVSSTTTHEENSKPLSSDVSTVLEELEPTITSFSSRQLVPEHLEDIDGDQSNIMLCTQYAYEIYDYLKEREVELPIHGTFMDNQKHVTMRMRNILVDWIVQVHDRFDCIIESLYLCVSIIDRFLQREVIVKDEFQLLGITALLVATKYEEMYFPAIEELVYITDKAYIKKQVLEMEIRVLSALDFVVGRPLPIHFLRRISRAANTDLRIHATAKYYMELSLIDKELVCFSPSIVASSAFYLANKVMGKDGAWDEQLVFYSGYKEADLIPVVRRICVCLLAVDASKNKSIPRKYAEKKRMRVSASTDLYALTIRRLAKVY